MRRLVVLHVNHALRGAESDADEAAVRQAAEKIGVPALVHRIDWQGERPSQASCRERRELFFRSQLDLAAGDRIYLAHHLNDQAETILQRLLRGTGVRGLAGMRPDTGSKVRPFLALPRAEIESYARAAGISWREDSSNASLKYERNWLRLEILPRLEARRPGLAEKLAALAEEAAALAPPSVEFGAFHLEEDWCFYRAAELGLATPASLSQQLRLSRLHTRGLGELLRKGSGRYGAEGVGFRLSCGILLAEKKPFAPVSLWQEAEGGAEVSNVLGRWRIRLRPGERAGPLRDLALGERAKKEFQSRRVPVFFRELVPLLVSEGGARALLPAPGEACGAEIDLAALGRWWLSPPLAQEAAKRAQGAGITPS